MTYRSEPRSRVPHNAGDEAGMLHRCTYPSVLTVPVAMTRYAVPQARERLTSCPQMVRRPAR